ncbi:MULTISPECIES: DUF5683 domain-containing protein [Cloacibacterium]|jgi:hypothetical protein|uniref:DUF5683 domain-containing protein n=2 Tax=root TaxID=1 RepID=A0A1E5UFM4_9FLAO|nr:MULTISPECIES: DUF5683 domain-containing protein [Cloacibacterium]MBV2223978.1 hypothetical protein [Cloacibacterium sp.]AZI68814.1 hypothetical protein EB819_02555 [Cloacibacterium normanense]OEL11689.1 hypothetical protein BHF72_1825 [Cloacibacterium normanense]PPZ91757.1 hypothetical protein C3729_06740 [Cloacibacterium normanense]SDO69681.1 hypothetical protein SAMN04489756_11443 [Cloacibacterium normanense]
MRAVYSIILLLFFGLFFSQEIKPFDTIKTEKQVVEEIEKANVSTIQKYNPTKAGLYSAVFPGLGQYYNKKYWKIPIVWGAVGTGVGIIVYNDKQYRRYRTAFLAELNGQPHEFDDLPYVDATVLGNTQDRAKRQRDYAIAITGVLYILNIVDAVVDAHLYDQKKDPDLAIKPTIIYDDLGVANGKAGLSLSFRF